MNVKRIVAKTSREAMRELRDLLGPDAVILSNRTVDGGVEVLAIPPDDIAALTPPVVEAPRVAPVPRPAEAARVAPAQRPVDPFAPPRAEPEPAVTFKR
ncbi:MAG: flagellar biosynthesis protein FlhF, partial [Gammaproteobacteria bacterium]